MDDFLSRPKSRTNSGDNQRTPSRSCSPITSRLKAPPKVFQSEGQKKVKTGGKRTLTVLSNAENKKTKVSSDNDSPIKKPKIDRAKLLARLKEREEEEETSKKEKSKFKPKASILPPSPGDKTEVNELDISPENKMYKGKIKV